MTMVVLLCDQVIAQKKQFTMAEATNGITTTLAPKGLKGVSWQPGTHNLWEVVKADGKEQWKVSDIGANNVVHVSEVAQGSYPDGETVTAAPAIKWLDKNTAWFMNGKSMIMGRTDGHSWSWTKWAVLPENAENIWVDKNKRTAYTIDNNLYLLDNDKRVIKVTNETDKNVVCGKPVHRDEFGIDRGVFFSPKGNYIAYYRMDQTMVNDYPIIKWDVVPAKVNEEKYPMAGGRSHEVTLCVYDPVTGRTVTMKTGEKHKDHYLTCVTWSPDEQFIYIAILSREQNHLLLNKYNARTGEKVKTLFEETSDKYVHPTHPLTFVPGFDNEFIWQSERDGYNHLYLYNTDGKLIRQLTKGKWVVNDLVGLNKHEGGVIFTSSNPSPLEKHIYSVRLDDGRMEALDDERGMHTATCSEDGEYILDVFSSGKVPKKTVVRSYKAGTDETHTVISEAQDPLADYDRPEVRNVTLKAADGTTTLYGKLILPTNFDSTKKYPVIVYLYNGPNVQLLHNSFPESGNLWYEYMAQHGYIIFTMDGRGSWNRGLAFEQATYRHLGDVEIEDQMKGVEYLKRLRYVDADRMGVHGWSFGGFMTTSLMLKKPGVFKCAVAGGPVMDWSMYEVMYTERYMDVPENNQAGYKNACLLDKVKSLKGKLLLIHGTNDNVVVWQHSIDFIKKCVDEGVQVDYFVYPGHEHNVRGKDRVHLMQKITNYFDDYLK